MWLISINQVYFSNLTPICFHVYFFFVAGGFEQPSGMEKQGSQFSDTMRHMSNILETTFGMINQMVLFGFCFCLVLFLFCSIRLACVLHKWPAYHPIRYDEQKGDSAILEQMIANQKPRFKLGSTSHPAVVQRVQGGISSAIDKHQNAHVIYHQCKQLIRCALHVHYICI